MRSRVNGRMMLTLVAVFLISVFSIAVPTLAAPPGMEEGAPYTSSKGNASFTELQNKNTSWGAIEGDGRWGWIVHGFAMDGGNFKGSIEVKAMGGNSWYLLSLYSEDTNTAQLLGVVGYYGRDAKYLPGTPTQGWADIALFQTDAEGNAKIGLPYTSPATDPVFGTLTAPMLPPGSYANVTVAVKYVGTGAAPDWSLVASGGYSAPGSPDARDYNLYEMAPLNFSISGSALLVKKNPSSFAVIWTGAFGVLKYPSSGSTFDYEFDAHRLQPSTNYSLIYYADGWPGSHPGALIATGTSNASGDVHLTGSTDLNMDLPDPADENYPTGAKIWLVPSSDYSSSTNAMTGWNPTSYLFENNWVVYDDTDVL